MKLRRRAGRPPGEVLLIADAPIERIREDLSFPTEMSIHDALGYNVEQALRKLSGGHFEKNRFYKQEPDRPSSSVKPIRVSGDVATLKKRLCWFLFGVEREFGPAQEPPQRPAPQRPHESPSHESRRPAPPQQEPRRPAPPHKARSDQSTHRQKPPQQESRRPAPSQEPRPSRSTNRQMPSQQEPRRPAPSPKPRTTHSTSHPMPSPRESRRPAPPPMPRHRAPPLQGAQFYQSSYYKILGIDVSASNAEIGSAFRKMSRRYHPDRNSAPDAISMFSRLNEAKEVLLSPTRRSWYDYYVFGAQATYYEILGIGVSASDAQIKSAFRKMSRLYHPDRNPAPEAKSMFLSEAKDVLLSPTRRSWYNFQVFGIFQ